MMDLGFRGLISDMEFDKDNQKVDVGRDRFLVSIKLDMSCQSFYSLMFDTRVDSVGAMLLFLSGLTATP